MPLFLPSDADAFPTGELKKVEKAPESKPDPRETWVEIKPGIFQNGLGQKKTGDMSPPKAALAPAVQGIWEKGVFLQYLVPEDEWLTFEAKYKDIRAPYFNCPKRLQASIDCCIANNWPYRIIE
jgi:hypothetical protein